ncbi:MAG TPA: hypothetical protein VIH57_17120 [Bacteroidales bacterium]
MPKPEISDLKHQDMLANALVTARDKSVLSGWWLSVPLYMLAALLMKTVFVPNTTLISLIHELTRTQKYSSLFFFVLVPVVFIVLNFMAVKRIHYLSGNPQTMKLLQMVWFNLLIIVVSLLLLIIYSL